MDLSPFLFAVAGTEVLMVGSVSTTTFTFVFSAETIAFAHGVRHLAAVGLSQVAVETAIATNIMVGGSSPVIVNGIRVLYHLPYLFNGILRVGTYYVP